MTLIACDPDATTQAGARFRDVATLIEQHITTVRNAVDSVQLEGRGQWVTAFNGDAEELIARLNQLLEIANEIGHDLEATAQGFLQGDTTGAGYFAR